MRAVVVDHWTEPADLTVSEAPEPVPGDEQVVVDVAAAGVNFFDTLIVRGKYQEKPPFPFTPGGEIAGVVRAVGSKVRRVGPGDRVAARIGHGGFAERALVDEDALLRLPDAMPFDEAAALPIVYGTAYAALVTRGATRSGETVLVTAAAGGVGLATVQIAHALGARVIALASGDKLDATLEAGAEVAIDYRSEDWGEQVRAATHGRGVDVVVENVGGAIFEGSVRALAWGGRLVVSGFTSGTIPEIRINRVLLKHISIIGVHFGPMAAHEGEVVREIYARLFEMYRSGAIRPRVSQAFPLERVAEALEALGNRQTVGKVIFVP
jgi:NADPH:quinone reductase